jgi:hypothetical protein
MPVNLVGLANLRLPPPRGVDQGRQAASLGADRADLVVPGRQDAAMEALHLAGL